MGYPIDPAKPTIVMMTDCPLFHTGQAVVVREVATGLTKLNKYNIVVAAWGYNGAPHGLPFGLVQASSKDYGRTGNPKEGIPGIEQIIDQVKPAFLWTVGDIWMLNYIAELKNRSTFKWIAYTPIDGEPIPSQWGPWLRNPDRLVMETEYGYNMVKKFDPSIDHRWIYHGCNPGKYYPLPGEARMAVRKEIKHFKITNENTLTHAVGLDEDDFVVGTLARNQMRKNYDRNLRAFSLFAKDKPKAKLWIHAAPIDQGYNLVQLAHYFGIQDKVIFTTKNSPGDGLSEEAMNLVVNMWDIHFLPTQGEGFGIPILETMSAGVPQVVPDYTSHVEFAKKGGLLIPIDPVDDFIIGLPHPIERALPKPSLCAEVLQTLYSDKKLTGKLSASARKTAEKMSWEGTIPQWDALFQELLSPPEPSGSKISKDGTGALKSKSGIKKSSPPDNLICIYRACNAELDPKDFRALRPSWFSKVHCFESLLRSIDHSRQAIDIYVVFDGDQNSDFEKYIKSKPIKDFKSVNHKSDTLSLLSCYELAGELDFKSVYFLEDDYLHTPDAMEVLFDGLNAFPNNLITLYDHPDRYARGDDLTKDRESVLISELSHWRTAESTTNTTAMTRDMFLSIRKTLMDFGNRDRDKFRALLHKNIRLINPVPGRATHVHNDFFSPFVDWASNNAEV
jgi:glycosyltransferase involved in cell wall biosynthesis